MVICAVGNRRVWWILVIVTTFLLLASGARIGLPVLVLAQSTTKSATVTCTEDKDGGIQCTVEDTKDKMRYVFYENYEYDAARGCYKHVYSSEYIRPPDACKEPVSFYLTKAAVEKYITMLHVYDCCCCTPYCRTCRDSCWERAQGAKSFTLKDYDCPALQRCGTKTDGGDPPLWGKIMAFPTIERHMGQDLNGDGDKNDTVLRYMNIETGEVVNTGAIVSGLPRAISIYDDVIAFVGERGMIRYYRISTGEIKDVGMKGNTPSLHGNILVFRSSEQIAFFDLASATFLDINIQGSSPTIYGDLLAFEWGGTVRYHDLMSKKTVDTKELGSSPFIWGDIIAFVADERTRGQDLNADGDQHDAIISYYRISTGETVYTGVSGSLPWVYGNVIVFCAYEWAGGKDLNADGKTLGSVIQYYDISTGEVVNTGILGAEPSIYQETITYYVWESWVGCDLTGDGDVSDPVVGFFRIGDGVWARKGADKE